MTNTKLVVTPAQIIEAVTPSAPAKKTLYTFDHVEGTMGEIGAKFTFANDAKPITINFDALTPEIQRQLMVHGYKQKVVDAAAIPRDIETGLPASDMDKIEAMREVATRLEQGLWRALTDGTGQRGGLLQRALTILYPNRDITAWLDKLTDKEKAAIRGVPAVAAEIDKIRAKVASSTIDANSLLAELDDDADAVSGFAP